MGTQEKAKIYYTWKGLGQLYDTEDGARKETNKLKEKGDLPQNVFAAGFVYKEEAEAFRKGAWDEYIRENYKPFDAAQYDAVVYTDGSCVEAAKVASYGLIIFFRNENKPHIESGIIQDVEGGKKCKIVKYDGDGEKEETEYPFESRDGKDGLVSGSHDAVSELFAVIRSLEICCKDRRLKKLLLVYDREGIEKGYHGREDPDKAQGDIAYQYRIFLQKLEREGVLKSDTITFKKIDSKVIQEKKEQYGVDDKDYQHSVYNNLASILAKAELGIAITPQEASNVFRAIPDEFRGFPATFDADQRRKNAGHARDLVEKVIEKYDGIFRPKF